jgi:hypothetical protein
MHADNQPVIEEVIRTQPVTQPVTQPILYTTDNSDNPNNPDTPVLSFSMNGMNINIGLKNYGSNKYNNNISLADLIINCIISRIENMLKFTVKLYTYVLEMGLPIIILLFIIKYIIVDIL